MPGQLIPVTIPAPAVYGINRQSSAAVLPLEWAVEAENIVINEVGKPQTRKGFREAGSIPGTPFTFHEYIDGQGGNYLVVATTSGIYLVNEGGFISEVTGAASPGNWSFANSGTGVVGIRTGEPQIILTSPTSTFTTQTPQGPYPPTLSAKSPLTALGRLWCLDGLLLRYTSILTTDKWEGFFDLSTIWNTGSDTPTAISFFNGNIVVFGEESIIVYRPTNDSTVLSLVETLGGIGCPFPRTIEPVGNDLMFLSRYGVRSLGRTLQEGKMPIGDVTATIQDFLANATSASGSEDVSATFDQRTGYYLLVLRDYEKVLCLHTRLSTPANTPPITEWLAKFDAVASVWGRIFFGVTEKLVEYKLTGDNYKGGATEVVKFKIRLPWWGVDENRLQFSQKVKFLKKAHIIAQGYTATPFKLCWDVDYNGSGVCRESKLKVQSFAGYNDPQVSQIPEEDWDDYIWFGESEFSGSSDLREIRFQLARSGVVLQLSVSGGALSEDVVIQSIGFQVKTGRLRT